MEEKLAIRFANSSDVKTILALIKELAEYEKLYDRVIATEEKLEKSIFGNEIDALSEQNKDEFERERAIINFNRIKLIGKISFVLGCLLIFIMNKSINYLWLYIIFAFFGI